MPEAVDERFPGGEWLDPVAAGIRRALQLLDHARVLVVAVAGAVVLLYVGAKVERELMKRQLEVVDGATTSAPERREAAGGDRG